MKDFSYIEMTWKSITHWPVNTVDIFSILFPYAIGRIYTSWNESTYMQLHIFDPRVNCFSILYNLNFSVTYIYVQPHVEEAILILTPIRVDGANSWRFLFQKLSLFSENCICERNSRIFSLAGYFYVHHFDFVSQKQYLNIFTVYDRK